MKHQHGVPDRFPWRELPALLCSGWSFLLLLAAFGCGGTSDSESVPLSELVARAQRESDPEFRARELIRLADRQRRLGDRSGARNTLALAQKACAEITDPAAQAGAWLFLARAFIRLGDQTQAEQFVRRGRSALQQIKRPEARVAVLIKLARAQFEMKQTTQAVNTLKRAEQEVASIEVGSGEGQLPLQEKAQLFVQLAAAYQKWKQPAGAQQVVASLEAMEQEAATPRDRSRLWALAAQARHRAGMSSQEAWQKAKQYAGEIKDPLSRGHAWADLAEAAAAVGRAGEKNQLLAQAEAAADQMQPGSLRNELLERIGRLRR